MHFGMSLAPFHSRKGNYKRSGGLQLLVFPWTVARANWIEDLKAKMIRKEKKREKRKEKRKRKRNKAEQKERKREKEEERKKAEQKEKERNRKGKGKGERKSAHLSNKVVN